MTAAFDYDEAGGEAGWAIDGLRQGAAKSSEVPTHYQGSGGRTCADTIRDAIGRGGMVAFWRGNAMKYLYRAGRKGGREGYLGDIAKAVDCLQRLLAEEAGRPLETEEDAE